ncbi:N-acetyl sugar amidotransferase [Butyrivibrio sp. INlla16]|uniref:N-acetyl sugar amidotransferase n=1 Tax=Butyrivibrio sp. INlla16 TaxID=1520807 RepID=UPI000884900A|nr:N-acetyl sugar amidotransferase [Butyrivibrio sp. INlla16]SDB60051.1 N-acetyl sugar amidotransferase [Butyrivibrio sp. INlla16]
MRYCKKCVMPNTRPGISFNEDGICSACQAYENRKNVNWENRWKELESICDKYRGMNGDAPDCAIAVSGGKDSYYQVYLMKYLLNMNPILFSVEDNFPMTNAGVHNLKNLSEEFACNIVSMKPNIQAQKKIMRYMFEHYGKPTWYIDRLIYTYPLYMANKFNTPLIVYGENVSYEYGGKDANETYSARNQLSNGVASEVDEAELIENTGVSSKDLYFTRTPKDEELNKLDPIYISYFVQWNSFKNYEFAKKHGFHDLTHEWDRTHHVENFDQIDSRAYLVHSWLKYPKFGHGAATDYSSRMIRYGLITREEGIEKVRKFDHALDPKCVQDFCEFCNYSEAEFWKIVDSLYNKDLFEKNEYDCWVLKRPIWKKL